MDIEHVLQPPKLICVECYRVETFDSGVTGAPTLFACFEEACAHYWLMVANEHGLLRTGPAILRRTDARQTCLSEIRIEGDEKHPSFRFLWPANGGRRGDERFHFCGFSDDTYVDIDFVRNEDARLFGIAMGAKAGRRSRKIKRPPVGKII
jgi:hypothetical protein